MASVISHRHPDLLDPVVLIQYRWATSLPQPTKHGLGTPAKASVGLTIQEVPAHTFADPPKHAPALGRLTCKVWGYGIGNDAATYPGPLFVATRTIEATFTVNNLLPDKFPFAEAPVDLGRAMPGRYSIGHAVVHLHGAELDWRSDGYPARIPHGKENPDPAPTVMKRGEQRTYTYPNTQRGGGFIWYHDHAMDMTARNVYAGLAGGYLLRAVKEEAEFTGAGINLAEHEIPLVLQDRSFTADGRLFYGDAKFLRDKAKADELAMQMVLPGLNRANLRKLYNAGPSPEFKGDAPVINGVVWPTLSVQPRAYRFRVLNGANSRVFALALAHERALPRGLKVADVPDYVHEGAIQPRAGVIPPVILQIGSDGGLLDKAVLIDGTKGLKWLILAPGERADIVIDFSQHRGQTLYLANHATGASPLGNAGDFALAKPVPYDPAANGKPKKTIQLHPFASLMQIKVADTAVEALDTVKLDNALKAIADSQATPDEDPMPRLVMTPGPNSRAVRYVVAENPVDLPGTPVSLQGTAVVPPGRIGWKAITFKPFATTTPGAGSHKPGLLWAKDMNSPGNLPPSGPPMGGPVVDALVDKPHASGANAPVELWEFYNISPDVHPIHLHLVQFQVLKRYAINKKTFKLGNPAQVDANERGWKDTVRMNSGECLQLLVQFKPSGGGTMDHPANFVWHCHLLEHEDMGMMRPLFVI